MLKRLAKEALSLIGLDVRLRKNIQKSEIRTWEKKQDAMWQPFLAHLDIADVVDVGANDGQFAALIHRLCPKARIISVEPLESCLPRLSEVLRGVPGSRLIRAAAGENPGTATMYESGFSPCSSLLAGTDLLGEDYQAAAVISSVTIPVVRLDDELANEAFDGDLLVKFDVQGYEIPAFRGAEELLKKAKLVVCEVCFFRRLYEGQPLFDDIYRELRERGFTYMGNAEQMTRNSDGRIVEADAIFERLV
jgi:FkbM family methyltransferase